MLHLNFLRVTFWKIWTEFSCSVNFSLFLIESKFKSQCAFGKKTAGTRNTFGQPTWYRKVKLLNAMLPSVLEDDTLVQMIFMGADEEWE